MENNTFKEEASEYFEHNPQVKEIGFTLITREEMILNGLDDDDLLVLIKNNNWEMSKKDQIKTVEQTLQYLKETSVSNIDSGISDVIEALDELWEHLKKEL